jgi:hypothetical protein
MKHRLSLLFFVLAQLLVTRQPVFAWDWAFFDFFQIPFTARSAALGGIHAASAGGVEALFSNPAGYRASQPDLSLAQGMVGIYDSGPSLIAQALAGEPPGISTTRRASLNLVGPLFFGYVGDGLGFGLFNNTKIRSWTPGPSTSGYSILEEDLVFISGYAFSIPLPEAWKSTLDVGFSIPLFVAARSDSSKVALDALTSSLTLMDLIGNEKFTLASGAGLEAGVLYSFADTFSVGIVARNLAMVAHNRYTSFLTFMAGEVPATLNVPLPLDLTIGILWSPPLERVAPFLDGFTLMLDYRNALDFLVYPDGATNPLLHISAGVEVQLLNILYLRAGFYQLLPSFGLDLDLSIFKLSIAVVGRELSKDPGGYPLYGYLFGLSF